MSSQHICTFMRIGSSDRMESGEQVPVQAAVCTAAARQSAEDNAACSHTKMCTPWRCPAPYHPPVATL
eukprot:334725-Chlamydomonas_euryale.AAC.3